MNYKYKVSIIVPCFNTKPWLNECLQSLVKQTLEQIEIICVNDGSTDGTGIRLDQWQAQHPNKIKVIHQINLGPSKARNAGMAIAQGECIGFVDSDDFVDATMYEKLYKVLINKDADVVRCKYLIFTNKPNKLSNNDVKNVSLVNPIQKLIAGNIFLCDCIFKKKFLIKNNINFIDNIYCEEDIIFTYKIAIKSPKMYSISSLLYFYRKNRLGQTTSIKTKKLYSILRTFEYLEECNYNNSIANWEVEKYIVRIKLLTFANYLQKIKLKYKKDFLFTVANAIFNKNSALDIEYILGDLIAIL